MLPYLLTNLDFAVLFRFVSPQFFQVISPAELFKIAPKLRKNYFDEETWEERRARTMADIRAAKFPRQENPGQYALRLFFFQLLKEDTWILDFRSEAFPRKPGGGQAWEPRPLYYPVPAPFLKNIRALYRGFYTADEAMFDGALAELGLTEAKECLRRHFGEGDQTEVHFKLETFQNTFADVFQVCKEEGLKLQTEFFVLGLMLLTLYQNLETHACPQDARACFLEAWERARPR